MIPAQRTRLPEHPHWCAPHPGDPDRRPLLSYADPRPRPTTHKQRVARSLAVLAFLGAFRRDADELRDELADAHGQIAELRLRADWGHDLADAQRRARELEAQLLADEAVSDAETAALPTDHHRSA